MVYKQAKSKNWWYKFNWNGEQIRESTKQTNKRLPNRWRRRIEPHSPRAKWESATRSLYRH
jgi:hypothetical protein